MKRSIIAVLLLLSMSFLAQAQTTDKTTELKEQAESSLKQKEYIKARYLFKRAYEAFAAQSNYAQAVECGSEAIALYVRENYYKEAFELCRDLDQLVLKGEQKENKTFDDLRFLITDERLKMYVKLKNPAQAKIQLDRLEEIANQSKSSSLTDRLLYTKVDYYYTFNQYALGNASFNKLISNYKEKKDYDKVSDSYNNLIAIARKSNNAPLMEHTFKSLIAWTDSVKALTAQDELNVLKRKYDESLTTIQDKESSLSAKQYTIIGLGAVIVILIVALIAIALILLKKTADNRKLKKGISIANEHNELKTKFIQNISAQMEPTLNSLATTAQELCEKAPEEGNAMLSQVAALKKFTDDIQELSTLENSLTELYDGNTEFNTNTFCEMVMDRAKEAMQKDVNAAVNAPNLQVKANKEHLERILLYLLNNAAIYTEHGHISLDFKKRAAHTVQFIVTDTGTGIPAELQDQIFKPFAQVKDLTAGDGLGLPICSLIATKMNGCLTLDKSYTKGTRFILELRS